MPSFPCSGNLFGILAMDCFIRNFQVPNKIPACAGMTLFGDWLCKGFRLPLGFQAAYKGSANQSFVAVSASNTWPIKGVSGRTPSLRASGMLCKTGSFQVCSAIG